MMGQHVGMIAVGTVLAAVGFLAGGEIFGMLLVGVGVVLAQVGTIAAGVRWGMAVDPTEAGRPRSNNPLRPNYPSNPRSGAPRSLDE